uniref:AlNc14C115G6494 protein n=1 Tax=Albugo laibachii Nc14 TaxID=890382 RepID=F0WIV7_9STRA|nr:AlNc14C115G6494 [Albugo laibachii Nc14]|eukprot:CCA21203.1 AlNc14C115G6494 [Albugo laibachii Nc14]
MFSSRNERVSYTQKMEEPCAVSRFSVALYVHFLAAKKNEILQAEFQKLCISEKSNAENLRFLRTVHERIREKNGQYQESIRSSGTQMEELEVALGEMHSLYNCIDISAEIQKWQAKRSRDDNLCAWGKELKQTSGKLQIASMLMERLESQLYKLNCNLMEMEDNRVGILSIVTSKRQLLQQYKESKLLIAEDVLAAEIAYEEELKRSKSLEKSLNDTAQCIDAEQRDIQDTKTILNVNRSQLAELEEDKMTKEKYKTREIALVVQKKRDNIEIAAENVKAKLHQLQWLQYHHSRQRKQYTQQIAQRRHDEEVYQAYHSKNCGIMMKLEDEVSHFHRVIDQDSLQLSNLEGALHKLQAIVDTERVQFLDKIQRAELTKRSISRIQDHLQIAKDRNKYLLVTVENEKQQFEMIHEQLCLSEMEEEDKRSSIIILERSCLKRKERIGSVTAELKTKQSSVESVVQKLAPSFPGLTAMNAVDRLCKNKVNTRVIKAEKDQQAFEAEMKRNLELEDQHHKSMIENIKTHHDKLIKQKVGAFLHVQRFTYGQLLQQNELQSLQELLHLSAAKMAETEERSVESVKKTSPSYIRRKSIPPTIHQDEVLSLSEMISPTEIGVFSGAKNTLAVTVTKPNKSTRVQQPAGKKSKATSHPRCATSRSEKSGIAKSTRKDNVVMDQKIISRCQPRALFNHDSRAGSEISFTEAVSTRKELERDEESMMSTRKAKQLEIAEQKPQKELKFPCTSNHTIRLGKRRSSSPKYPSIPIVSQKKTNVKTKKRSAASRDTVKALQKCIAKDPSKDRQKKSATARKPKLFRHARGLLSRSQLASQRQRSRSDWLDDDVFSFS